MADLRPLLMAFVVVLALQGSFCADFADEEELSTPGVATTEKQAFTPPPKRAGAEEYTFQAEVNRLMDIIIHSLYTNKDIFLRELISNAADALDKLRFLSLTDKGLLGDKPELEIRISVDHEKKQLLIRDTGIGMTRDELVKNLGTIAKSGTSAFLEQMQKGGDVNLIGQFGVGFYSVYLVGDYVEVISKHHGDKQHIWESSANGNFAVSEDHENEPLGHGTLIKIHFKEDAQEYLEEARLKELVAKYSEFINFPIYLYTSKQVDVEMPVDEEPEDADEAADKDPDKDASDDVEDVEDEEEEEAPKTKTTKETRWDWELLNDNKALWLRNPSDVSEEDYSKFYKALVRSEGESALAHAHFKAEGDVEFRALLYVPDRAPPRFMDEYYSAKAGLKLYVRRVFISDEFEDLIPRYLGFLRGIVDSDTLPLSVSREALQAHASLKTIKKKLVRKALDLLKRLSDAEAAAAEKSGEDGAESDDVDEGGEATKYTTLWRGFGKALKLGVIEDAPNRGRLARLLRFRSSKSADKLTSLDAYVARMKEGQTQIYYLSGESQAELAKSPFLERLLERGYEVLYLTDPVDEYLMQHLTEFDDKPFQNASKDNLKLAKGDKLASKAAKEEFKDLVAWWREQLDGAVSAVKVSARLATSPAIVVTSQYAWSANMERIMRAQALAQGEDRGYMKGMKTLEVNPRHPLVQELKALVEKDKESEAAKRFARVLFDTALLESGFHLEETKDFNARVYALLADAFAIKRDITAVEPAPSADAEEEDEGEGFPGIPDIPRAQPAAASSTPELTVDASDIAPDVEALNLDEALEGTRKVTNPDIAAEAAPVDAAAPARDEL